MHEKQYPRKFVWISSADVSRPKVNRGWDLSRYINPFLVNVPIWYHLRFSGTFGGYQMGKLARNRLFLSFWYVFFPLFSIAWSYLSYLICSFYCLLLLHIILIMTKVVSYRNQSNDLLCKSVDWCLYGRDLRHERVK